MPSWQEPIVGLPFTDKEKLEELRRERKLRRRHYPRWIEAGRLDQSQASRQVAILAAIEFDYAVKCGEVSEAFELREVEK